MSNTLENHHESALKLKRDVTDTRAVPNVFIYLFIFTFVTIEAFK